MLKGVNKKQLLVHIGVWGFYIACNILILWISYYPNFDDYYGNIFHYLSLILVFYLNAHYVIDYNFKPSRIPLLILFTMLLFWLYVGLLYSFQRFMAPLIYGEPSNDIVLKRFVLGCIYNFLPF